MATMRDEMSKSAIVYKLGYKLFKKAWTEPSYAAKVSVKYDACEINVEISIHVILLQFTIGEH